MYVDLLSNALDDWAGELTGPPLVRYVRVCRDALFHPGAYGMLRNADLLAAEITYDRALVQLCSQHAISVDPEAFIFPAEARARLESALAAAGVSLELATTSDDPYNEG
jgi:hypothetical protein